MSQLILATTSLLLSSSKSARNRAALRHCVRSLSVASQVPLTPELVRRVTLSRYEEEWTPIVELAAALIQGQAPSPVLSGQRSAFSLLFSLHHLFESVLRRSLHQALIGQDLALSPRPESLSLLQSLEDGRRFLRLRPDYLFVRTADPTTKCLVADAKWKQLMPGSPSFGIRPEDVYQLTTYMTRHQLSTGALFFPLDQWMETSHGYWSHSFQLAEGDSKVHIFAIGIQSLVSKDKAKRNAGLESLRHAVFTAVDRAH